MLFLSGFWLKRDVFYEQPQINLRGEYLVLATTSNLSSPIICSTFSYYKENLDFLDVCSIIKVTLRHLHSNSESAIDFLFQLREVDSDMDGKIDRISLNIRINIFDNKVTSVNVLLPINYKLTVSRQ